MLATIDIEQSISKFDMISYLISLQAHHEIFYILVDLTKPHFIEDITTCAVAWNKDAAQVELLINPSWFFALQWQERLFALSHESLHVFFAHFARVERSNLNNEVANIAEDIVINEFLVSEFGFNRANLPLTKTLAFIDTVFTPKQIVDDRIATGRQMEYYYHLLIKNCPKITVTVLEDASAQGLGKGQGGCDGKGIEDIKDENGNTPFTSLPDQVLDDIGRQIGNRANSAERADIEDKLALGRGSMPAGITYNIKLNNTQSSTWEDAVKDKIKSLLRVEIALEDCFKERHRRITNLPQDMFIPVEKEFEIPIYDKFNLKFFFDCSVSCIGYKQQFFDLMRSIPRDKFNIDAYSFDTNTHKLNVDSPKVYGGGGTCFDILEARVQRCMKDESDPSYGRYPDLVFVLTDGDGNSVRPQVPQNWYWILTSCYDKYYIPKGSHTIPMNQIKYNLPDKK